MDDLKGSVVLSLAGKDEGHLFVVLAADGGCIYYADGRKRRMASPKKKKLKHVRILGKSSVTDISAVTDKQLRKAVYAYETQIKACAPEKEE